MTNRDFPGVQLRVRRTTSGPHHNKATSWGRPRDWCVVSLYVELYGENNSLRDLQSDSRF